MKRETKIILKSICLAVSCIVTIIGFLRPADDDAGIGILVVLLWGTGPYLIFWLATYLLERFSSIRQVPGIGFGISVFVAIYALAVYAEPLNHKSSTEGLIFLFAPLWLYLLLLPLLGLCVFVAWLSNRQLEKESQDPRPD
jgi:hypothetical protein